MRRAAVPTPDSNSQGGKTTPFLYPWPDLNRPKQPRFDSEMRRIVEDTLNSIKGAWVGCVLQRSKHVSVCKQCIYIRDAMHAHTRQPSAMPAIMCKWHPLNILRIRTPPG
jgi:hypothetical protein